MYSSAVKNYSNGNTSYKLVYIGRDEARKQSRGKMLAYFAELLHEHPEGIVVRFFHDNTGHVVTLFRYKYDEQTDEYTLYVKENVGNKCGPFFSTFSQRRTISSESAMYNKIDFIVYVNGPSQMKKAYQDNAEVVERDEYFTLNGVELDPLPSGNGFDTSAYSGSESIPVYPAPNEATTPTYVSISKLFHCIQMITKKNGDQWVLLDDNTYMKYPQDAQFQYKHTSIIDRG